MKLQLKRSLKTLTDNITAQAPTVDQMEYGELAINYATTDATIFLKDSNNVIQKLQVSAVPDVPAGETLDDRYVSLSGSTLTGSLTAPSFIGGVARTSIGSPTTGQNGELWWNTSNGRLYIYDGDNSSWVDASPDSFTLGAGYYDKDESDARYVAKAGSTMTGPLLLSGNPGGEALAATPKQYVDGQVTGLDTTLRTYIDAQIATRAATTYVNTQLSLKADTTYVTSAITTSETAAATAYVSKSGDVISGDLTANAFIGDGSQLTGVGSETIISNTPPTPANYEVGTMWWNSDSTDTSLYILYQDPIGPNGDPGGKYWIEASPAPDSIGFSGTHTGDSTFTGNMSVTGNGTFAGSIASSGSLINYTTLSNGAANSQNSWTLAPSSTTTQKHLQIIPSQDGSDIPGVLFYKSGIGNVEGNTDVFIGGDLTGDAFSPKISLKGDGSATFASGTSNAAGVEISKNNSNASFAPLYLKQSNTSGNLITGRDDFNGVNTFTVSATGSASFASYVESDLFSVSRSSVANKDNYSSKLSIADTGKHFNAKDTGGSTVASINADGSAEFASRLSPGTSSLNDHAIVASNNNAANATLIAQNYNDSGLLFKGYNSSNDTVTINADGSATFAAGVYANYFSALTDSGSFNFYRSKGAAGDLNSAWGVENGTQTIQFYNNGSATFASDVTLGQNLTGGYALKIKAEGNSGNVGGIYLTTNPSSSAQAALLIRDLANNEDTVKISTDGSATFTGANGESRVFGVKRRNNSNPSLYSFEIDGNGSTTIGSGNIILDYSGSATFASDVFARRLFAKAPSSSVGLQIINVDDNDNVVFNVHGTGNVEIGTNIGSQGSNINLNANGSASFGSFNNLSNTTNGVTIDQFYGSHSGVRVQSTSDATTVGEFFAGYRGTIPVFQVLTDGSTMFGPNGDQAVKAGYIARATSNVNAGVGFANFGMPGTGIYPSNATGATVDNALIFGTPSGRWKVVYAATGSINTSDANEKQDVRDLEASELAAATELKTMIKAYRWKDAVAAKGDDARIHFGVIAQDVQSMFTKHGLDASKYGFWCSDTWYELDGDVVHPDENGEYPEGVTPKTRLGIRYDELFAFIISAL